MVSELTRLLSGDLKRVMKLEGINVEYIDIHNLELLTRDMGIMVRKYKARIATIELEDELKKA